MLSKHGHQTIETSLLPISVYLHISEEYMSMMLEISYLSGFSFIFRKDSMSIIRESFI